MIVSWNPVIGVDVIGSFLTLIVACACARLSWDWKKGQPDDIFRDYIFLLTLAFVFFAVSRSFGHLVKQYLIFYELKEVWRSIAPFSGAVNTAAFIIIFAFGIYFQRFASFLKTFQEKEHCQSRSCDFEFALCCERIFHFPKPLVLL